MFKALRPAIIAIAVAGTASGAYAAADTKDFGMATSAANADHHIVIQPDTTAVDVDDGDTVEFFVGGKNFTWHFDTLGGEGAFDLSKIAPEGVDVSKVTVYVASNPLYRG